MKKLLILLSVGMVLLVFSCKQEERQSHPKSSSDYRKAYAFLDEHTDSAFYYFNKVTATSKDSLEIAKAYNIMGMIQSDAGDNYGAQESLSRSLKLLTEKNQEDRSILANDYNELGIASTNLKNYDQAIDFFNQSLRLTNEASLKGMTLANKANVYRMKKDYRQALQLYREVMRVTKPQGARYARLLTNMVTAQWRQNPAYNPAPELLKALKIRLKGKDLMGVNSSYAHLTDFYMRSRQDSALFYAEKWYDLAKQIHSPDDELDALATIIRLKPSKDIHQYFATYQHINDSVQMARNAAKNQFALVRYEAEKNKADLLKLQKDNTEKKYELARQSVLLYVTFFVLVSGGVLSVIWYRRRKQRLEWQAKTAIRESQLRTSKKVHDVVANGLYRMMTEIEYQSDLDKDQLVDKIEDLYERSRDISYEDTQHSDLHFHERISELITSFGTGATRVILAGNHEQLWQMVNTSVRHEVECILLELMVNMKKHSQASDVVVRFERENDRIQVYYADNGIGIPGEIRYKNGLTNTGNRIASIAGTLTFETKVIAGLKIHITFPAD